MEIFEMILILLVIIALSNIAGRFLPLVPLPLIQIALGMILTTIPLGLDLTLNPELFFVLFIAPLLFNDGKRVPRDELWQLRVPILLMSLGLVFFTTVTVGYIIHFMIPAIPLPASFGLAAILSPTDAVAVTSMASRAPLPKRILRLLEGEALMNDASGLVAFKFAIAAAVSGTFSASQAIGSFIVIAVGGLIVGAIFSLLIIRLRVALRRWGMEDVTVHMLILILTPFLLYLAAEELHVSGILAVVAGGVVHAIEKDRTESRMVKLQVVSTSTWSVILYVLNGLVFLLLGLQIPDVASNIFYGSPLNNFLVIGYILVLFVVLLVIRFLWVYLFWEGRFSTRSGKSFRMGFFPSVLTSLSGVRGAVTLAGAFTIPLLVENGSEFPQRDLILFLAAGVILVSLIVATISLPILTRSSENRAEEQETQRNQARTHTVRAALRFLHEETNDENRQASHAVATQYESLLRRLTLHSDEDSTGLELAAAENEARLIGLRAERKEIHRLLVEGQLPDYVASRFEDIFQAMETALARRSRMKFLLFTKGLRRLFSLFLRPKETEPRFDKRIIREAKLQTCRAAINAIRDNMTPSSRKASLIVIGQYRSIIRAISQADGERIDQDLFVKQKQELQLKAYQVERDEVQALFEKGTIGRDAANALRSVISYAEANVLEGELSE